MLPSWRHSSVLNYIKQLQHTDNHRRHGAPVPNCTSPEGLTRLKQAYNELVQVYWVLGEWAMAPPPNDAVAATNGRQAIQHIKLTIGSEPLININRNPAIFMCTAETWRATSG